MSNTKPSKKRDWIEGLLNALGLEVLEYQTNLVSRSHVRVKVLPMYYPGSKPQTLRIFIDPGYKINFKFSKYLDNNFQDETKCMVAGLLMTAAQEYAGPDVEVDWVTYHKASPRGSVERPDSCYMRLVCSYLPWKGSPEVLNFYNLKCRD